ncbi:tRNA pseudouridine(13) synthase TruD [Chromohalobacter japonicus]|uniref:tRNA pseudouridine(13) synthase TruD n=1 Tax=Chromohalobacter japonicus TaxID=223900 RepID=UPI001FF62D5E|nr:tRNA pseudouridine(13) synthase TruD [Chromohalobacter japonicus]MCK0751779.1 tRNA pseudouridine(13) synthase TruD [Chromohalobacter japonicus]
MIDMSLWPPDWPRVHGGPLAAGEFRMTPEDFRVEEVFDFAPEGQGEHLWLWIEKRDLTTPEAAKHVARVCGVRPRDVGYSGLKDRIAVTRQWLSVHLPGRDAPAALATQLSDVGIVVQEARRHPRKLKRGVHRANHFTLRLSGEIAAHPDLTRRWQRLCADGVPNYFGPQRFGREGRNLVLAQKAFARGWRKRDDPHGMQLSAARSFLFNEALAARLRAQTWRTPRPGDVLTLAGTASRFVADEIDTALHERAARGDVTPTGPLWGRGRLESGAEVAEEETRLATRHEALMQGLEAAGVRMDRRVFGVPLDAPSLMHETPSRVTLGFGLPRGAFATSVLRELMHHPLL